MSDDNGAGLTPAEKQQVVDELYRRWREAAPKPIDGKPAERTQAYNRLANVCHELGMPNPADDEAAAERSDYSLMINRIVTNVRRDLGNPKAAR